MQCVHHHSAHVPADIQGLLVQVKLTDLSSKHKYYLSHDAVSVGDITPCNKIDKPLVVGHPEPEKKFCWHF